MPRKPDGNLSIICQSLLEISNTAFHVTVYWSEQKTKFTITERAFHSAHAIIPARNTVLEVYYSILSLKIVWLKYYNSRMCLTLSSILWDNPRQIHVWDTTEGCEVSTFFALISLCLSKPECWRSMYRMILSAPTLICICRKVSVNLKSISSETWYTGEMLVAI